MFLTEPVRLAPGRYSVPSFVRWEPDIFALEVASVLTLIIGTTTYTWYFTVRHCHTFLYLAKHFPACVDIAVCRPVLTTLLFREAGLAHFECDYCTTTRVIINEPLEASESRFPASVVSI